MIVCSLKNLPVCDRLPSEVSFPEEVFVDCLSVCLTVWVELREVIAGSVNVPVLIQLQKRECS